MDRGDIVILLARQRSGTNPLRSVLSTHSDVFCVPEIFNSRPTPSYSLEMETNFFGFVERRRIGGVADVLALEDKESLFEDFLDYLRCFTSKPFIVVDVKYNSSHHLDGAWKFLSAEPMLFTFAKAHGMRVVHLRRRNLLRYYLSEAKAQALQRWHAFDESVVGDEDWFRRRRAQSGRAPSEYRDPRIEIDPTDLLRTLELCRCEDELVERSFAEYDRCLRLEYSELFESPGLPVAAAQLHRIAKWLGIDPTFARTRPEYKKQGTLPLRESIVNFAEVQRVLYGTPYEHCLHDESVSDPGAVLLPAGS